MSSSKKNPGEILEGKTAVQEQPPSTPGGGEVKPKEPTKIGLARFLRLSPQKKGVTALLGSKHAVDVKTREQWEIAVQDLLSKKAR
jgi:hypothetical protein